MAYSLGIILASICIVLSIKVLGLSPENFFDEVAAFIVIGGTIAVGIILMPWQHWKHLIGYVVGLIFPKIYNPKNVVRECMRYAEALQEGGSHQVKLKGLPRDVLNDGQELLNLGFGRDDIEEILQQRISYHVNRTEKIASGFRNLSKYPPAFGLMGTVFGLVELMRAITEGLDPSQTGSKMAIALVATLYGLVMANLIVSPIAESISKRAKQDTELAVICLEAVLMVSENQSLVKVQEFMNSHLASGQRIDYLGGISDKAA